MEEPRTGEAEGATLTTEGEGVVSIEEDASETESPIPDTDEVNNEPGGHEAPEDNSPSEKRDHGTLEGKENEKEKENEKGKESEKEKPGTTKSTTGGGAGGQPRRRGGIQNYKFYCNEIVSQPSGNYIDQIHETWFYNYERLESHHGYCLE